MEVMDYIKAKIIEIHQDYILVEGENKVGYRLFTLAEDEYSLNRQYILYIHEEIKVENNSISIKRFAFLDPQVKRLFQFLIELKGIGPKVAKGIIFSFGNSKNLIDSLNKGEKAALLNKKYWDVLYEAINKPKNKQLLEELAQGVKVKSIKSEVLWILLQMDYGRDKCIHAIDSIDNSLIANGNQNGIEGLRVEEAVKECLSVLFKNQ